jgi:transposase
LMLWTAPLPGASAIGSAADEVTIDTEELDMLAVTTVGFDIARSIFQVHGVNAQGQVFIRQRLRRSRVLGFFKTLSPCVVGIEACASSHHWSSELRAPGHAVRLMPPAYVKPYLEAPENDAADAAVICEVVQRPSMRAVPTKTPNEQACLVLRSTRYLFTRQQTAVGIS